MIRSTLIEDFSQLGCFLFCINTFSFCRGDHWSPERNYAFFFVIAFTTKRNPIVSTIPTGRRIYALLMKAAKTYITNEIAATLIA